MDLLLGCSGPRLGMLSGRLLVPSYRLVLIASLTLPVAVPPTQYARRMLCMVCYDSAVTVSWTPYP